METNKLSGLIPRRLEFDAKSVHVGFLAYIVAIEQVLFRVMRFSAYNVSLAIHNNHSPIYYQRHLNLELGK
jgi:hypothetical protein